MNKNVIQLAVYITNTKSSIVEEDTISDELVLRKIITTDNSGNVIFCAT